MILLKDEMKSGVNVIQIPGIQLKCVSLEMFFHLADATLVSEITVKVLHLHFFVQVFTLSPLPSCPFGFEEYVWIRELECFGE